MLGHSFFQGKCWYRKLLYCFSTNAQLATKPAETSRNEGHKNQKNTYALNAHLTPKDIDMIENLQLVLRRIMETTFRYSYMSGHATNASS